MRSDILKSCLYYVLGHGNQIKKFIKVLINDKIFMYHKIIKINDNKEVRELECNCNQCGFYACMLAAKPGQPQGSSDGGMVD